MPNFCANRNPVPKYDMVTTIWLLVATVTLATTIATLLFTASIWHTFGVVLLVTFCGLTATIWAVLSGCNQHPDLIRYNDYETALRQIDAITEDESKTPEEIVSRVRGILRWAIHRNPYFP